MKNILFIAVMILLVGCSKQYPASQEVNSQIASSISSLGVEIEKVLVSVDGDNYLIETESRHGVSVLENGSFPAPNVYFGFYKLEYKCDADCALYMDADASENMSDSLLIELFGNQVTDSLQKLSVKIKNQSNT